MYTCTLVHKYTHAHNTSTHKHAHTHTDAKHCNSHKIRTLFAIKFNGCGKSFQQQQKNIMVQEIRKAYTSTHKHQLMRVPLYIQEVTQPLEVNAKIIISKMQTHRTTSNTSATTQVQYAHTNTHTCSII